MVKALPIELESIVQVMGTWMHKVHECSLLLCTCLSRLKAVNMPIKTGVV